MQQTKRTRYYISQTEKDFIISLIISAEKESTLTGSNIIKKLNGEITRDNAAMHQIQKASLSVAHNLGFSPSSLPTQKDEIERKDVTKGTILEGKNPDTYTDEDWELWMTLS